MQTSQDGGHTWGPQMSVLIPGTTLNTAYMFHVAVREPGHVAIAVYGARCGGIPEVSYLANLECRSAARTGQKTRRFFVR
jgi:hypothetical protein